MKSESKNIILAVICTILVFWGLDLIFPNARKKAPLQTPEQTQITQSVSKTPTDVLPVLTQKDDAFIEIQSETLKGKIHLQGLVFDNLTFLKYKETIQKDSPDVTLLNNQYFMTPYFYAPGIEIPNAQTVWHTDKTTLTPMSTVTLTWKNAQGVTFTRQISLDDKYMFTFNDFITAKISILIESTQILWKEIIQVLMIGKKHIHIMKKKIQILLEKIKK